MEFKLQGNQTGLTHDIYHIPVLTSVSCCLALSVIYVASLYIGNNKHGRDHPITVKRRFCGVFVAMLIAPVFVYKFSCKELLEREGLAVILGLRVKGLLLAAVVPFFLTVVLFLGPICVQLQNDSWRMLFGLDHWKASFSNILWIRNHIVAPLSEEFVFRACMMPLILQSFSPVIAVFVTPLFFGTAHVHHIVERLSLGMDLRTAVVISCFQLIYTTLFGFYSSFLFVRTGHFVAPFLVHAFCNHMGFPDVQDLWQNRLLKRFVLLGCYLLGFTAWIFLLPIATQPVVYHNSLYWGL